MNNRKLHKNLALLSALPLIVIVVTGILLQVRREFEIIQPKLVSSEITQTKLITLEEIAAKHSDKQIDQIIYRPTKKNIAIRYSNGDERQIHPVTGEIIKEAPRYTTLLIKIHQGSWLGSWGEYGIHLPAGIIFLVLIITGLTLIRWRKS